MSIYQDVDYVLLTDEDYTKYRSSTSFNKVSTVGEVVDNTFFFDSLTRVLTAQSSNNLSGGYNFFFPNTYIGDMLEVECDIRSVSGEYPRLYFSETSAPNTSGTEANSTYMTLVQQGQWETIQHKFIIKNTQYNNAKLFVGLITNAAGRYQIKNLRIRLKRSAFNKKSDMNRTYTVNKYNGSWIFDEYSFSDVGTISIENNAVKITFDIPYTKKPIPIVTPGNSSSVKYKVTAIASQDSVSIAFYDSANAVVPPDTTVSNNTMVQLAVFGKM
ncbi:hypothetical protein CN646_07420 [Bacillus wiedmannii]|uniref:hypothetical protein n=1 Tax=Bacillus wiedmannii TaxID=1890302 RepID=UPI000BF0F5E1|nr:hypothetical protein [Bacillus wiedmannii]PEI73422.1 hypothetical protein CN646_07420 [Bacillus wiedmannii]